MWNTPAGHSAFDGVVLVAQLVAFVLSASVLAAGARLGALAKPALIAAAALTIGTPIVWQVAFPPVTGIEGAGRLMLGVPAVLLNLLLLAVAARRRARRA